MHRGATGVMGLALATDTVHSTSKVRQAQYVLHPGTHCTSQHQVPASRMPSSNEKHKQIYLGGGGGMDLPYAYVCTVIGISVYQTAVCATIQRQRWSHGYCSNRKRHSLLFGYCCSTGKGLCSACIETVLAHFFGQVGNHQTQGNVKRFSRRGLEPAQWLL